MRSTAKSPARARPARRRRPLPLNAEGHPYLLYARQVLQLEAQAIEGLGARLGESFVRAVELILDCRGHVVVTGIGKPGFIAQKMSAVLASTGIPSLYLHPAEAAHGDLGRVTADDVVITLSNSGKTEEIIRLLPAFRKLNTKLIAITGDLSSPLAQGSDFSIDIGKVDEACPMGLVPTTSSALLNAICDTLAMTVLKNRPITRDEYALFHPGGSLGRRVMKVAELMRTGDANPVVLKSEPLSKAVAVMTNTPGRPGATSIVDAEGRLVGIFTDGDLRRLIEKGKTDFTRPIQEFISGFPRTSTPEELVHEAATRMREAQIDQIPVLDRERRPVGLLDIQDLLAARFL